MDVPTSVLPVALSEFGTANADTSNLDSGLTNPWLYLRVTAVVTPPSPHAPFQLAGFFKGDGTNGDPCDGFIGDGRSFGARLSPENWTGTWSIALHLESGIGSDGLPINVSNDQYPSSTANQLYTAPSVYLLNVVGPNPMAKGFRSKGFLRVDHASPYPYYRFSNASLDERDRYFLKTGVNSPENFLAYEGFWETDKNGGTGKRHDYLKSYGGVDHEVDVPMGAPTWVTSSWDRPPSGSPRSVATYSGDTSCNPTYGAAGTGIIGAIQYLQHQGMNSLYMLPMNLGGDGRDGRDVHPFAVIPEDEPRGNAPSSRQWALNYSVKRLQEWNTVFEFANQRGLMLQFVLHEQEKENVEWLGYSPEIPGTPTDAQLRSLTIARRLYLKQMVAHFGHNLGIKWNLCEENSSTNMSSDRQFTVAELRSMAEWIERWDGYGDHPITVHTVTDDTLLYDHILAAPGGDWLDASSTQSNGGEAGGTAAVSDDYPGDQWTFNPDNYGSVIATTANLFATAGRNGVVDLDEQGSYQFGASGRHENPSPTTPEWLSWGSSPNGRRRLVLYQALFSGAGVEFYFPGLNTNQFPEYGGGDTSVEEFRSREALWGYCAIAQDLLHGVPKFWTMVPNQDRVVGEYSAYMGQALVFENADTAAGRGVNFHAIYYPQIREKDLATSPTVLGTVKMAYTAGSGLSYAFIFYDPSTGAQIGSTSVIEPNGIDVDPALLSGYVVPSSNDLILVITQI